MRKTTLYVALLTMTAALPAFAAGLGEEPTTCETGTILPYDRGVWAGQSNYGSAPAHHWYAFDNVPSIDDNTTVAVRPTFSGDVDLLVYEGPCNALTLICESHVPAQGEDTCPVEYGDESSEYHIYTYTWWEENPTFTLELRDLVN